MTRLMARLVCATTETSKNKSNRTVIQIPMRVFFFLPEPGIADRSTEHKFCFGFTTGGEMQRSGNALRSNGYLRIGGAQWVHQPFKNRLHSWGKTLAFSNSVEPKLLFDDVDIRFRDATFVNLSWGFCLKCFMFCDLVLF